MDSGRGLMIAAREKVAQAIVSSPDRGQTIDLSHQNLTDIPDDAAADLLQLRPSRSRNADPNATDDNSPVSRYLPFPLLVPPFTFLSRIALSYNRLSTLPLAFSSLKRLRYLNLRSNMLSAVPAVVRLQPLSLSSTVLTVWRSSAHKHALTGNT